MKENVLMNKKNGIAMLMLFLLLYLAAIDITKNKLSSMARHS